MRNWCKREKRLFAASHQCLRWFLAQSRTIPDAMPRRQLVLLQHLGSQSGITDDTNRSLDGFECLASGF